jgi:hypothetical protein
VTRIKKLLGRVERLEAQQAETAAEPKIVLWLPRNGRGPQEDFRSGGALVRFFDRSLPAADEAAPS